MERKDLIAQNIKALREEHGLTQQELADKLHVTRQAVTRWENEYTEPDLGTILAIADIFGVSADYLITSKDNTKEVLVEKEVTIDKYDVSIDKPVVDKATYLWNKYWKRIYVGQIISVAAMAFLIFFVVVLLIIFGPDLSKSDDKSAFYALIAICCFVILVAIISIPIFIYLAKRAKSHIKTVNDESGYADRN